MKKILFVLGLLLIASNAIFSADLIEIRNKYYLAADSKDNVNVFVDLVSDLDHEKDETILGYKGMAFMLKARYSWNPYSKFDFFKKGRVLLETAINKDKTNIELIFMRFCIQSNAPSFLFYNQNIEEDKKYIIDNWEKVNDIDLKNRIKEYMTESSECSEEEQKTFN